MPEGEEEEEGGRRGGGGGGGGGGGEEEEEAYKTTPLHNIKFAGKCIYRKCLT
jgi:hypothetical protein